MLPSRDCGSEGPVHARRWGRLARHSRCFCAGQLCMVAVQLAPAAPVDNLYDLTIETGMPHLEENLRYAIRHERRCVDTRDLSALFPVLQDVSLQDCKLADAVLFDGGVSYTLRCGGGHGTTGQAAWHLEGNRITGTLDVKLGGKNMTFYQRITGRLVGRCGRPGPVTQTLRQPAFDPPIPTNGDRP